MIPGMNNEERTRGGKGPEVSELTAREIYIEGLKRDREKYLYQHALNKARTVTRTMKPDERAEYLAGQGFASILHQVRRRDRIYQLLCRGEFAQSAHAAEFEHLEPLINAELKAGRVPDLEYLRSVDRSRISPAKAARAVKLLKDGAPGRLFSSGSGENLSYAEGRVEKFLSSGDVAKLYSEGGANENVVSRTMETVFRRGITPAVLDMALHPDSLASYLKKQLTDKYPELAQCGKVICAPGRTVAEAVRDETKNAAARLTASLKKRFPQPRIRALLRKNPGLKRIQKKADTLRAKDREIRSALLSAVPEHYRDLYPLARQMTRKVFLHIGPTNSGKTFESVGRLHSAFRGIYLGPLRLLAAEQFESLNLDDVPCSLVTGEEQIRVPDSRVQSSTVEMADLNVRYDVAVIDECQMIGDRDRGGAWSAAILGLCADELHLCASPDAEALLTEIITDCGDELTVIHHERMTPLEVEKQGFQFPASVMPGDALIVFSKARVHAVAAELRSAGFKVSLIYGALPPDVRRDQAGRFSRGDTQVVVSTDAIAMGMNLPIQRIVFLESEKYDGDITRTLTDSEIKQIAGRAGRYGKYDVGYVNAFGFKKLVAQALARPLIPLSEAVIRFPESLLGIPLPLTKIIEQWLNMQDRDHFSKASAVRMANLAAMMETKNTDKLLLYRFLCIPFDETDPHLLARWRAMYQAEKAGEHIDVLPELPEIRDPESCTINVLDWLEDDYRRCDLYYNYVRLFLEEPGKLLDEIQRRKDLISQGIIHILSTQKLQQKTCRSCNRRLPWNWPYRLCDACFNRRRSGGRGGHFYTED